MMKARTSRSSRLLGWWLLFSAVVAFSTGTSGAAADKEQGSPTLNAYFATDFTDTAYQQAALSKVLKGWKLTAPLPAVGKKTVVISTIGRDGSVLETRYNMKTGNAAFDEAALSAVKNAAPLPAFPGSYTRPTVEVHWHFEIVRK